MGRGGAVAGWPHECVKRCLPNAVPAGGMGYYPRLIHSPCRRCEGLGVNTNSLAARDRLRPAPDALKLQNMFGSFRRYFSTDLAIDLGTANTLIYVCLLYTSPSPRD